MKKKNILTTMFSLTGVIVLAKIFGFVKQMMIAGSFGTTEVTDLINLAQNFIYNIQYPLTQALFTAGATIYISLAAKGANTQKRFVSDTLKLTIMGGLLLVLVVYAAAPLISWVLAPTYSTEKAAELTRYLRIFSPLLLCYLWNSVLVAILNASDRYLPGEMMSINNTLVTVAMLLLLERYLGEKILVWSFFAYTIINAVSMVLCPQKHWNFPRLALEKRKCPDAGQNDGTAAAWLCRAVY